MPEYSTATTTIQRALLGAILLLALVLRIAGLGEHDYWHDEVQNLLKSDVPWQVLTQGEYVSNHPPLFTLLLSGWRGMGFDGNEWSVRLLPALLGVATVMAIHRGGLTLFGPAVGLVGAFLLAISPFHIAQSQELKEYIVLPLTGTMAVIHLFQAARDSRTRDWAAYAVWAGLACYSDLFAGPLLLGVNLWYLAARRGRPTKSWFVANCAGALLFLPELGIMLGKARQILLESSSWWIPEPSAWTVVFYLKTVAFGYSGREPHFKIALILFVGLVVVGLWAGRRRERASVGLLVAWFAIPVVLLFGISHVTESVFLTRALIPFAIPLYLLAAVGLTRIPNAAVGAIVLVSLIGFYTIALIDHYEVRFTPTEFPHRPGVHAPKASHRATDHILANWESGDLVVHTSASTWLPMYWYGLRQQPMVFGATRKSFIDHINEGNPRNTLNPAFEGYFPKEIQTATAGFPRVWLVFSEWERVYLRGSRADPGNASAVWLWLEAHGYQDAYREFDGITLMRYAMAEGDGPAVLTRGRDDAYSARFELEDGAVVNRIVPDNSPGPRVHTRTEATPDDLLLDWSGPHGHTFTISNPTRDDVECRITAIGSAVGLAAASLYELSPNEEIWEVVDSGTKGPPQLHGTIPVLKIRLEPARIELVHREILLPTGTFRLLAWVRPEDDDSVGLDLGFRLDEDVLEPSTMILQHWMTTLPFEVPSFGGYTLAVEASTPPDSPGSARLAFLAIVPSDPGATIPLITEDITVSAGARIERDYTAVAGSSRVDIFVASGHAAEPTHWIFRQNP